MLTPNNFISSIRTHPIKIMTSSISPPPPPPQSKTKQLTYRISGSSARARLLPLLLKYSLKHDISWSLYNNDENDNNNNNIKNPEIKPTAPSLIWENSVTKDSIDVIDNGQVSSEHTENAARKKNGTATTYNANGIIIRQENWNNGQLDGTSTSYHHDGSTPPKTK